MSTLSIVGKGIFGDQGLFIKISLYYIVLLLLKNILIKINKYNI